ncbi:hypothetical protein MRB53_025974 [Persea americana]|uniref:Uncharacterized protein n=1 Tax=Persea americana TaxID=3435 RepID=A0ACC2LHP0_PERAE|nr:hypothetical protein MRB53_025974 [Persea americana]
MQTMMQSHRDADAAANKKKSIESLAKKREDKKEKGSLQPGGAASAEGGFLGLLHLNGQVFFPLNQSSDPDIWSGIFLLILLE